MRGRTRSSYQRQRAGRPNAPLMDGAAGLGGEDPPGGLVGLEPADGLGEALDLVVEGVDLRLEREDAADALQVDALDLAQLLHVAQLRDVAQRVPTAPAPGALGHHEAEPVVAAQGLRVHVRERRRHRHREHRGVGVERLEVLAHGAVVTRRRARRAGSPAAPSRRTP